MVSVDLRTLRFWRWVVCAVTALDCAVVAVKSHWRLRFDPDARAPLGLAATDALLILLAAVALSCLYRYARPRGRLAHAVAAFAAVEGCFAIYAQIYPSGFEDFVQASASFLGWLLGHAVARAAKPKEARAGDELFEQRWAAAGFLSLLATTYLNACMSKLIASGGGWAGGRSLQMMVLSHYEYAMSSPLNALRWWVGNSPTICGLLAACTLIIQGGAFLLTIDRTRRIWALLLIAFHLGIWTTSRILFVQVLILLFAIAFPIPALIARKSAAPAGPEPTEVAPARLGGALLCLAGGIGMFLAVSAAAYLLAK